VGDVNCDRKVLVNDSTLIRQYLYLVGFLDAVFHVERCNVIDTKGNGPETCQVNDSTAIRRHLIGLTTPVLQFDDCVS